MGGKTNGWQSMKPRELNDWRLRIETVDLSDDHARQELNSIYSELISRLREEFLKAEFPTLAKSIDSPKRVEASNPETSVERLWDLITHYPLEVTSNSIWPLRHLAGEPLYDSKNNYVDDEHTYAFAQTELFWQDVYRERTGSYHDIPLLSYTAILESGDHPFQSHQLIKDLYASDSEIDGARVEWLRSKTDELFCSSNALSSSEEAIGTFHQCEEVLVGGMDSDEADRLLSHLLPALFDGDELLSIIQNRLWGEASVFMDASPIADLLTSMSKTRLVDRGFCATECTLFPDEVYRKLASHRNSTPKSDVAKCPFTPEDVFEDLAKSSSKEIVYPLAANTMTPLPILKGPLNWSGWGSKTVERIVKDNPAYLNGEAWQLMEIGRVFLEVEKRKKSDLLNMIEFLEAGDSDLDQIRLLLNAAVWSKSTLEPSELRLKMIRYGWANEELFMSAAWSWHWIERLEVAKSPLAPEKSLEKLRNDGLPFIRHAAAQPRISKDHHIEADSDHWISDLIALADSEPFACINHPRFSEWLEKDRSLVEQLFDKKHARLQSRSGLPECYFHWRLEEPSTKELLRCLNHRDIPSSLLSYYACVDEDGDFLPGAYEEALLVASSAAAHVNRSCDEELQAARKTLNAPTEALDFESKGLALFLTGCIEPEEVTSLSTTQQFSLFCHPSTRDNLLDAVVSSLHHHGIGENDHFLRSNLVSLAPRFHHRSDVELSKDEMLLMLCCRLLGRGKLTDSLQQGLVRIIVEIVRRLGPNALLSCSSCLQTPRLSDESIGNLATNNDSYRRLLAACSPNLSADFLMSLCSDPNAVVREAIALRDDLPEDVARQCLADQDVTVRRAALKSPSCPLEQMKEALGQANNLLFLLMNPALPLSVQLQIFETKKMNTLLANSRKISCFIPESLQCLISKCDNEQLDKLIAGLEDNPCLKPSLLEWMAGYQLEMGHARHRRRLRLIAATHRNSSPELLLSLARQYPEDLAFHLVSHPNANAKLFESLAPYHSYWGGVAEAYMNESLPLHYLDSLYASDDPDQRVLAALHPRCPVDYLLELIQDTRKPKYPPHFHRLFTVADIALLNPNLSGSDLSPAGRYSFLARTLRSQNPSLMKRLVLRNPLCPPDLLKRSVGSLDWRERHAVVLNRSTPVSVLQRLRRDPNQIVLNAVNERLNASSAGSTA